MQIRQFRPVVEMLESRLLMIVTSEGVASLRAQIARSTYNVDGSGVKIGIISDSFDHLNDYASDVAAKELPAGVQVLKDSDLSTDSDEGRAMAQIIYDVAPGASLLFYTSGDTQAEMATAITSLKNAGAKVIVDDIGFPDEPFFQDGVISQAIDSAAAAGVTYVTAAGNSGRQGYESTWRFGQNRAAGSISGFPGGATFDFNPAAGLDDLQSITVPAQGLAEIWLQWDQPIGNVTTDLDLYVLNSAGTSITMADSGTDDNIASGSPLEVAYLDNTTNSSKTFNLMIVKSSGPDPQHLKWINAGSDISSTQYATNSGTVVGHEMAVGAISVGAADYINTPAFGTSPPVVEDFSSVGPQTVYLAANGSTLANPIVRNKPDLVGPDGVSTTVTDFDAFYGTSAAAPHIAGVAALLLDAKSTLTPAQVLAALKVGAIDMDDPSTAGFDAGADAATGIGLVQADKAIASILGASISGNVFNDFNADGAKAAGDSGIAGWTLYLDTNNNNAKDAGEVTAITDAAGNFTFSNLTNGTYHLKQIFGSGFRKTLPGAGVQGYDITISGAAVTGKNFGNTTNVFLSGTVFNDANNNGVKDAGETGVAGAIINIVSNGGIVASRTTGADGKWTVIGLSAGTGQAVITAPSGYNIKSPSNGRYSGSATSGQQLGNLNFGLRKTSPLPAMKNLGTILTAFDDDLPLFI